MEEGEDEIEEEISDEELAELDKQEKADRDDIENQAGGKKSKKDKKGAGLKRKAKKPISLEYEEEHETEVVQKKRIAF